MQHADYFTKKDISKALEFFREPSDIADFVAHASSDIGPEKARMLIRLLYWRKDLYKFGTTGKLISILYAGHQTDEVVPSSAS